MATEFFRTGHHVTDTATDEIVLHALLTTSGNVSTLRAVGATSGYQITSAKRFVITKIDILFGNASNVEFALALGYADNDVGMSTTTARTNPVALIGAPEGGSLATTGGFCTNPSSAAVNDQMREACAGSIVLPLAAAGKYLYVRQFGGTASVMSVIIRGREVS